MNVSGFKSVHVRVGDFSRENPNTREIAAVPILHEAFHINRGKSYDIAVLKLSEPVDKKLAIPLCRKKLIRDRLATCGMGTTDCEVVKLPSVLQEIMLQEVSEEQCRLSGFYPALQICTVTSQRVGGTCPGDSGGSVYSLSGTVFKGPKCIYGIISQSEKNGGSASLHTRVNYFLE